MLIFSIKIQNLSLFYVFYSSMDFLKSRHTFLCISFFTQLSQQDT